jgi:hypothetical protein
MSCTYFCACLFYSRYLQGARLDALPNFVKAAGNGAAEIIQKEQDEQREAPAGAAVRWNVCN